MNKKKTSLIFSALGACIVIGGASIPTLVSCASKTTSSDQNNGNLVENTKPSIPGGDDTMIPGTSDGETTSPGNKPSNPEKPTITPDLDDCFQDYDYFVLPNTDTNVMSNRITIPYTNNQEIIKNMELLHYHEN